jgi:hypothetical protein
MLGCFALILFLVYNLSGGIINVVTLFCQCSGLFGGVRERSGCSYLQQSEQYR